MGILVTNAGSNGGVPPRTPTGGSQIISSPGEDGPGINGNVEVVLHNMKQTISGAIKALEIIERSIPPDRGLDLWWIQFQLFHLREAKRLLAAWDQGGRRDDQLQLVYQADRALWSALGVIDRPRPPEGVDLPAEIYLP